MLEPKAGIFLGRMTARIRDELARQKNVEAYERITEEPFERYLDRWGAA
jgi:hypothetical protein